MAPVKTRAFPALSQLAISHAHAVDSLGVREVLTVRGLKLVDQTGPGEAPRLQVRLGRLNRLGVPVGMGVVDAPNRIRVREAVTVRGRKLVDQTGLGEAPRLQVRLGRLQSFALADAGGLGERCRRQPWMWPRARRAEQRTSSLEMPFVWC